MVTPEDDSDRLAERIWNEYGDKIEDVDSFNEYFDKYMTRDFEEDLTNRQDKILRKEVFESIREKHKSVIEEQLIVKKGRPRKKFPKVEGKKIVDGDREAGIIIDRRKKQKFTYKRYVKNADVRARKETLTFTIKKKEYTRIIYRDRFGRFTSEKSLRTRKGIKLSQVV